MARAGIVDPAHAGDLNITVAFCGAADGVAN